MNAEWPKAWLSPLGLLLIAGCASEPPKTIEVPIPVPCVASAPTPPADCLTALPQDFTLDDATACLLRFRDESLAYQAQANALLDACKTIK